MNIIRASLLAVVAVFVVLYLLSPRHPKLALAYLRWVVLAGVAAAVLTPFAWLVAAAFKDKSVFNEYVFLPPVSAWSRQTINLNNFRRLFAGESSVRGTVYFWQYLANSVFLSTTATSLQLFFCSLGGYALAKYNFRGKSSIMSFMFGSMMVPGVLLMAPIYGMMVRLHLIDSYQGLLLPGMVSAYGIFLFRQAISAVPDEIVDAGRIDGCTEFSIYLRLVMPLVRPMSAAFCLVSFLGSWNSFFAPNVFLHTQSKLTLPVVLNLYISQYASEYGVFLAGTLLAIVPPALLFFALEKEFISGLAGGAVKG